MTPSQIASRASRSQQAKRAPRHLFVRCERTSRGWLSRRPLCGKRGVRKFTHHLALVSCGECLNILNGRIK